MRVVAEQLGMPVEGTRVKLPEMLGQGFFSQYTLCEWLTLNYLHFFTHEPLMLVRRPVKASPWIPVIFYTTAGYEQIIGESSRSVGIDTLDGIFMPSCHIPTEWRTPPGVWLTNVTLTFHGERVQPLLDGDCYLARLLHSWQSFYLFETITPADVGSTSAIDRAFRVFRGANRAKGRGGTIHKPRWARCGGHIPSASENTAGSCPGAEHCGAGQYGGYESV